MRPYGQGGQTPYGVHSGFSAGPSTSYGGQQPQYAPQPAPLSMAQQLQQLFTNQAALHAQGSYDVNTLNQFNALLQQNVTQLHPDAFTALAGQLTELIQQYNNHMLQQQAFTQPQQQAFAQPQQQHPLPPQNFNPQLPSSREEITAMANQAVSNIMQSLGNVPSAMRADLNHAISINHKYNRNLSQVMPELRALFKQGASPAAINPFNPSQNLFHVAVESVNDSFLKFLLEYPNKDVVAACLAKQDNLDRTPLHMAATTNSEWYVDLLLQAGANPNTQDSAGNSAWSIVVKNLLEAITNQNPNKQNDIRKCARSLNGLYQSSKFGPHPDWKLVADTLLDDPLVAKFFTETTKNRAARKQRAAEGVQREIAKKQQGQPPYLRRG